MKTLNKITAITGILLATHSFAQNEIDALRYSQNFPTGTARFVSMGGAFGALGGDFSSLSVNPAGIGIYRKSELSFTPSVFVNSSATNHYGNLSYGSKTNFNFGNAGLVATFNTNNESGWISSNIAFGYNRMNNFNNNVSIEGVNKESSLLDVYKQQIAANNYDQFGSNLAWNTYLVDSAKGAYFTAIPNHGEVQKKSITRSGSQGETFFSFGGNYDNKLYLGGSIGFPKIRYTETSVYEETPAKNDTTTHLKSFSFNENLTTTGSGINFKFGMMYRIQDFLRVGAAVHSPTYYDLHDTWSARMNAKFDTVSYADTSRQGINDYSMVTPFKAIGSVAVLFGKAGLISMDYEYLDYSSARLTGRGQNSYSYSYENSQIKDKYTAASNIRIGTEWKINPFSLRAGFGSYGNPFASGINNKANYYTYSAGFGFREENYFIDFAYVLTKSNEKYYLYNPDIVQPTNIKLLSQSFLVTLGLRF